MMLGHEIFDPEIGKRVLVDHAFIVAGGEITKAARNWLGNKLDASKRSQILFMDRNDILNLFVVTNLPLPSALGKRPDRQMTCHSSLRLVLDLLEDPSTISRDYLVIRFKTWTGR